MRNSNETIKNYFGIFCDFHITIGIHIFFSSHLDGKHPKIKVDKKIKSKMSLILSNRSVKLIFEHLFRWKITNLILGIKWNLFQKRIRKKAATFCRQCIIGWRLCRIWHNLQVRVCGENKGKWNIFVIYSRLHLDKETCVPCGRRTRRRWALSKERKISSMAHERTITTYLFPYRDLLQNHKYIMNRFKFPRIWLCW